MKIPAFRPDIARGRHRPAQRAWLAGLMLLIAGLPSAPLPAIGAATPALLLAKPCPADIDPAPYWISEKLDGVRAYWDGRQMYFRSGRTIPTPDWFTRGFPRQPLDGELWLGRGRFERLSGILGKARPVDGEWREVGYWLFELPGADGGFTERLAGLRRLVTEARVPWLHLVEHFRIADRQALRNRLDSVVAAGGEGLMLHREDAPYLTGRQDALLKLKPWQDDEATVVAHLPGRGRHAGRLGALLVRDANGREFRLGTGFTDSQRERPPPVGSTVTYRYQTLTARGLPRFPVFLRQRELP